MQHPPLSLHPPLHQYDTQADGFIQCFSNKERRFSASPACANGHDEAIWAQLSERADASAEPVKVDADFVVDWP